MKIQAIRIENLASLGGKTEINFTEEPLCSAGIFAITGPTGSGKSTILDALCLALYARTPRYRHAENSIDVADVKGSTIKQGDVRGILRDGSSSGYAEVDFVGIDDLHYRATWSVRRARNKAEGNLQPYEMSLKNISTDQDIPGKKTELLPEIERLVGLNFEQFTRSVLLAQGDFTAFLKAGKDEKSSLLEKLTGTYIYSEISKKVYEHHKEESQQLKILNVQREGIATLTTEELKEFQELQRQLDITTKSDEKQIADLDKEVHWHEQWIKFQEGVQSARQQYDNASKEKTEAKSREDQFQQITRVQSARPIFTELRGVKAQHISKSEYAASLSAKTAALLEQKKEADATFEKTNTAFNATIKEEQEAQPLLNSAKALDVKLVEKSDQIKQASDEVTSVNHNQKLKADEYAQTTKDLVTIEEEIDKLKQWKAENESRQPIAEQENLILSKLRDAEGILVSLRTYNSRIQTAEENSIKNKQETQSLATELDLIKTSLQQKHTESQALATALSNVPIRDIENEKSSLDTTITDIVGATAHWKLLSSALLEKDKILQELKTNKEALERNNSQLVEAKRLLDTRTLEKSASLAMLEKAKLAAAESVDELRKQLEPEEPCPVCGSTDHPYASHHPGFDYVLSELESEHKKIESEYVNQLTFHSTLDLRGTQLEKLINGQEEQSLEKNTTLIELESTWSEFQISTKCNAFSMENRTSWLQEQLEEQRRRQQQLKTEVQSYTKQKEELDSYKVQLTALEKEFNQVDNKIKDADRTLKSLEDQKKNDITEQGKINKTLEVLRRDLSGYFFSEHWFDNWQSHPDSFITLIKEFTSNWKTNTVQLDTLTRSEERLIEKKKGLDVQLSTIRGEVKAKEQRLTDLQTQNKQLLDQRIALFAGAQVMVVESKLKAAIDLAKQTLEDQRIALEKIQGEVTRNSAQHEQLVKDIESLSKHETTLKEQLQHWITNYISQYETALSEERLLSLLAFDQDWIEKERMSLRTLDDAVMQSKSVLEERTKALASHAKQRSTEKTLEELTTVRTEVEESRKKHLQQVNEIQFKIKEDTLNKQRIGTLLKDINKQTDIVENWAKLNEIIGSSDGKKFRQIAQEYTLDVLLSYANVHLEVLSKRYILQRIPNSLGLQVLDQDMGDEVRTVYSLSGGESFLVSLALALGLASLSSTRMKVESLFIDEGFGSLDPATLNIAMDALERLHNQGRKVGVISHVQEMTERIPVQIKVSKQQSGKSKVEVIGY